VASLINDANGRWRVGFTGPDGKRFTVRIGKTSEKAAESFRHLVEALQGAQVSGRVDAPTAARVAALGDVLHGRLAAVGLVPERQSTTLGPWLTDYMAGRRAALKPSSYRKLGQTRDKLIAFFGAATPLRSIAPHRASEWRQSMAAAGLSEAAIKTHAGNAKGFFAEAARRQLVAGNAFLHLKSGATASAVERYLGPDEADRVVEALPDPEWKLLFGLARFAGLRVPSESHLLTWADVDFDRGRLSVRSPKTERHAGHERRTVPISPKLMALLQARFDGAEPGEERLVTKRGEGSVRVLFARALKAAKVDPWPKLFQTLRSSCEVEWAQVHPQYVVSKWMGHGIQVSGRHYAHTVPDEQYERATGLGKPGAHAPVTVSKPEGPAAAQKATQHATAGDRTASHGERADPSPPPDSEPGTKEREPVQGGARPGNAAFGGSNPSSSAFDSREIRGGLPLSTAQDPMRCPSCRPTWPRWRRLGRPSGLPCARAFLQRSVRRRRAPRDSDTDERRAPRRLRVFAGAVI
jgi:integrase